MSQSPPSHYNHVFPEIRPSCTYDNPVSHPAVHTAYETFCIFSHRHADVTQTTDLHFRP